MDKYQIFDGETENHKHHGRFASPWHPENYMVAHGWKNKGDSTCSYSYQNHKTDSHTWTIPEDVTVLVGHNLRFDLSWVWKEQTFIDFIKRGGKVWCTQYAEYLLEGHDEEYHMNTLENLSVKYGGTVKVDAVKAMWEEGKLTSEIPKDLLIDYLIGTKEEGYNGGDIGNTEKVYLAQLKRAEVLGMMEVIEARMDGYLATTEMEMNGIHVNMQIAVRDMMAQQIEVDQAKAKLDGMLPNDKIPHQVKFNWGSGAQVSAVLFGGYIRYKWSDHYVDETTGELARTQKDVLHYYLEDGSLVQVEGYEPSDDPAKSPVRFKSGKKKGEYKTKKVKMPVGDLKKHSFEQIVEFQRQVEPLEEWKGKQTDALDRPIYSVGSETIECLSGENNELAKLYADWKGLTKVLDTYYLKTTQKGSTTVSAGMLTFVKSDSTLNHYLNHTSTVTGRMSSKSPNLQNIPRADTSIVKQMFTSRFGEQGVVIEADYSQLEVVVQGYLSKDPKLIEDIKNGVDFHCKRTALKAGISYETAVQYCKVDEIPEWVSARTQAKRITFQAQYGAGVKAIAKTVGMDEADVIAFLEADHAEYPLANDFSNTVKAHIEAHAIDFKLKFAYGGYKTIQKGYYESPTGTRYCFRSEDAPAWLRKKGVDQTFKPTKIKNYPTQGTGGEIMQIQLGRLFRACVSLGFWSNGDRPLALLVNTVHDCVWGDCHESVHKEFGALIRYHLTDVPNTYQELFGIDVGVPFKVDVEYGRDMMKMSHELH